MSNLTLQPSSNSDCFLERVPAEVWYECWSRNGSRELHQLALVCNLFHKICRPLLFQGLSYQSPYSDEINQRNWKPFVEDFHRFANRFRMLAADEFALMVRNWSFFGVELDLKQLVSNIGLPSCAALVHKASVEAVGIFVLSLPSYQNLETLSLGFMTVDEKLRQMLTMLPSLDSLTLDKCALTCRKGPLLTLKSFSMSGCTWRAQPSIGPNSTELLSPERLKCILIDDHQETESFLSSLVTLGPFHHLTHLNLCVHGNADLFFSLLGSCSQLQSLDIIEGSRLVSYPDVLSPTVLPFLKSYKGPTDLARLFIPGRPVETVHLRSGLRVSSVSILKAFITALLRVSESTSEVRELSIGTLPPGLKIFHNISTHFPRLRTLQLSVNDVAVCHPSSSTLDHGSEEDEEDDEAAIGEDEEAVDDDGDSDWVDDEEGGGELDYTANVSGYPNNVPPAYGPDKVATTGARLLRAPDSFLGMLDWLALGHAHLPLGLEVLDLELIPHSQLIPIFLAPSSEQRVVVLGLSTVSPSLRRIMLGGYASVWERGSGDWSGPTY